MKKIFMIALCAMFLTSCSGMKQKIMKMIDTAVEEEATTQEETPKAEGKLCIFGTANEKPFLLVDGEQVSLGGKGSNILMDNLEGNVVAAITDGDNVYALCCQEEKLILYTNDTAEILDKDTNTDVARIVIENGKPVVYAQLPTETGDCIICRYANGTKTTVVDANTLRGYYLKHITVNEGKLYGVGCDMSQFGIASLLAEGHVKKLEDISSDAYKVYVNGAEVMACGFKCDKNSFSESPDAANKMYAVVWRNGKPEVVTDDQRVVAYAKDGDDEYMVLIKGGDYDEGTDSYCTLWKNGKKIEDIEAGFMLHVAMISVKNGNVTVVLSKEPKEGNTISIVLWENGTKKEVFKSNEMVLVGANK